ncbi:hypothetical protein GE061_004072 [Apolygus lucorum]|uniref:Peptidase A1 domain-containing protein n=1 Tax=Apolygus lucorum TaxID=248454 RepID=A0A8S9WZX5_APOLU|nr:hypothetical protein GE061_004072 [Apolygus lucorum]
MPNFPLGSFIILPIIIGHAASDLIHSVELKRVDSPLVTMLKQNIHPREIEAMLRAGNDKGNIPVPLLRFMDNDFYGDVLFGHPGQTMRVSFDTSWLDTWVPTITCSAISPACFTRRKYDPNRSPFSVRTPYPFKVIIGEGELLLGRVYYDLIHINQVNITKQGFGAVSQIPFVFVYSKFDGIFGLNMGNKQMTPPVIWNMKQQGLIERKVFSFYFNRNPASEKGGTLVFGGVEPRHYKGNFTYMNVIPDKIPSWKFRVDQISITTPERKTIVVCEKGCDTIAATGSNPISGPLMEIDDLNKAIKAREWFLGRYTIDCNIINILPKVTFSIGGRNFTLNGKDYVQQIQVSHLFTLCLSSFKANDITNDTNWFSRLFITTCYTVQNLEFITFNTIQFIVYIYSISCRGFPSKVRFSPLKRENLDWISTGFSRRMFYVYGALPLFSLTSKSSLKNRRGLPSLNIVRLRCYVSHFNKIPRFVGENFTAPQISYRYVCIIIKTLSLIGS